MEEDSQSWQDRCDRYFTSISDHGETKQNGHVKNKDKPNIDEDHEGTQNENQDIWNNLTAVRRRRRENPVISYIRKNVYMIDIHGAKLAGKSAHWIELLIWCIIILAVFSFTIFLLVLQSSEYAENETLIKVQSVKNGDASASSLSLSVCNLNVLRQSAIQGSRYEYLINDSVHLINNTQNPAGQNVKSVVDSNTKLKDLLQGIFNVTSAIDVIQLLEQDIVIREMFRVSNQSVISRLRNTGSTGWLQNVVSLTESDVKSGGHQREDTIVSCLIGSRECKESELSSVTDTELGNCMTVSPEVTSAPVQLILNAQAYEYIVGAAPSVGFKVIVHRSGSDVREGKSLNVGVNSLTSVHVQKETVTTRIEGTCIPEPDTQKQCLRACHTQQIQDYCGCSIDDGGSFPVCRNEVIADLICRKALAILQETGHLDCGCKENCRDTSFDLTQSTMLWPPENYMPILRSLVNMTQVQLTDTQLRENIAALHIDFKVESRLVQEETKQFGILELLSRLGGLLAFVAGMSMLTMVEILWTILKTFIDVFLHYKKRSSGSDEVERLSDSAITSVTWAMYKQQRRKEELQKESQLNNARTDRRPGQSSGLGGNVNSRLHRRNGHLEPVHENVDAHPGIGENNGALQRAPSDGRSHESRGSNRSLELKQSKYRVPNGPTDSGGLYSSYTNGQIPKIYPVSNGSSHNGVSLISGPNSNNAYYNYNRKQSGELAHAPYMIRKPMTSHQANLGRRYEAEYDRVQLYGNTSAYFHANGVSEPTFL